jgi:hypothetical protein
MSMEMHLLFRGKLPSKAALTRTMKELGFPFSIAPPGGSLEQQTGFMPMRFRRDETGVEFDVFDGRADVEDVAGEHADKVDPSFDRSANFRWGGDEMEMLAGMCAAAALAKLVDGVVVEDEEGLLLSVDEAVAFAKKHIDLIVKPEGKDKRPGTRPADIKRYLKPLLKMRSDLALVDRRLVVRPVRHLLRGALLDRTSDKYSFRMWRYVMPLFAGSAGSVGYGDYFGVANCPVWQPHFEPLLMDALAEDIFGPLGNLTTLADFPDAIERNRFLEQRITALVLGGERERALAYVEQIVRDDDWTEYWKNLVRKQWERVSGDIESVCAEFHAKEAETIKELKLEHIWEPSPFPVELPVAERASRSAEPPFSTTPWVSRPSWLLQEVPEQPGEVRFAKQIHQRHGRVILQMPLTRQQAEERHREREHYALAVRLADGLLYTTRFLSLWDRNDPDRDQIPPSAAHCRSFKSSSTVLPYVVWAAVRSPLDDESMVSVRSIEVHESLPANPFGSTRPISTRA